MNPFPDAAAVWTTPWKASEVAIKCQFYPIIDYATRQPLYGRMEPKLR